MRWPYFEASCLRDTRNPFGQARDVRLVSTDRLARRRGRRSSARLPARRPPTGAASFSSRPNFHPSRICAKSPAAERRRVSMIVLIDNYDSFTFNLVHFLGDLGAQVRVHRNDKITSAAVIAADPDAIVLSPRPLHAQGSRHLPRSDRRGFRHHPDSRRLPRPSGDRRRLRRQSGARAGAGARQALGHPPRRRQASFAASTRRSRRRAIIRWSSSARACRTN